MKKIIVLLVALTFSGCVSIHTGKMAAVTDPENEVLVSVKKNSGLSDDYYFFLEYTVENQSSDWITFKVQELGFEGIPTEILVNDRLSSWVESKELELRRQQYNNSVIMGSIAVVGGVAGAVSSDGNLQTIGMATMTGALVAGAATDIDRERSKVAAGREKFSQTVNVPKTYILNPFEVAPGSYLKRWVVVKRPKNFSSTYTSRNPLLVTSSVQGEKEVSYRVKVSPNNY